jgi:phosphoribosylglycinamide formyltransferase-1
MAKIKLAVLVSGRGSNMEAIINAVDEKKLDAEVSVVLSDNKDAPALDKAQKKEIPAFFVDPESLKKEEYSQKLLDVIKPYNVDLIVLAGFMRIIGKKIIDAYPERIINIHPSLLPSFPGLDAQKQAFQYGVKYSGCTVHFVDYSMDTGPIIGQAVVPVEENDTVESLTYKILKEEHKLYPEIIQKLSKGRIKIYDRRVQII